jgi:hypothetical protein
MKHINSIEEDLLILQECDITVEELFFIKLLFSAQEQNGRQNYIIDYYLKCKHSMPALTTLEMLADKNVIDKKFLPKKGDKLIADNIYFTEKFLKNWFVYAHVGGKELMDAYPNYLKTASGDLLPAKNITKVFMSLEAMYDAYGKSIRFSRVTHNKVMYLLNWAKEQNLIKYGIAEFVSSRKWDALEQDYEKIQNNEFDNTYDNRVMV